MTTYTIPANWSKTRQNAARWFIEDVVRKARMAHKPDAVEVEVTISDAGQLSVTADSALYHSCGTCFIGPRGGINHRNGFCSINFPA